MEALCLCVYCSLLMSAEVNNEERHSISAVNHYDKCPLKGRLGQHSSQYHRERI